MTTSEIAYIAAWAVQSTIKPQREKGVWISLKLSKEEGHSPAFRGGEVVNNHVVEFPTGL